MIRFNFISFDGNILIKYNNKVNNKNECFSIILKFFFSLQCAVNGSHGSGQCEDLGGE
jgi:hypothetical protein